MRSILEPILVSGDTEDPDACEHRFAVTFSAPGGPARLAFGGVATSYDVLVDGLLVGSGTSMFEPLRVGVDLDAGEHRLELVVHPLDDLLDSAPRRPRPRWRTPLVSDQRLRWLRTTVLGRCPGLPSGPPPIGPWRPVVLETGPDPFIEELRLRPRLDGADGVLDVRVVVRPGDVGGSSGDGALTVELEGPDGRYAEPVRAGRAMLRIPDVTRWWPHTHGAPVLHEVRVLLDGVPLVLPGDATTGVENTSRALGFRTISNADDLSGVATGSGTSAPSLDLSVNDVAVFCRGAVWTPGDLAALDEAVALGLNMVRVPGWATYESDAFHERCDRLGLLVWQDLMFAGLDVRVDEPALGEAIRAEVGREVARLRHHPSAVVVCGSSDTEQQAAMLGLPVEGTGLGELAAFLAPLVRDAEADVIWVPSAPTGGELPFRVGEGIATYFGVGAYRRPISDARLSGVRFAAECLAFAQVPDDAPPRGSAQWRAGVPRDGGASWDFDDVREHYLHERYGDVAAEDWLPLSQRVTGEVMAEVIGLWRAPDHPCRGALVLSLRDLVPGPGWGLLDHRSRPKPGARGLAAVCAPRALWLRDDGLDGISVQLANDTAEAFAATLTVTLGRADGSTVIEGATQISVPARGHLALGVEGVLGRFVDASYAFRFGTRAHDVVDAVLDAEDGTRLAGRWVVDPAATPELSPLRCSPSHPHEEHAAHV